VSGCVRHRRSRRAGRACAFVLCVVSGLPGSLVLAQLPPQGNESPLPVPVPAPGPPAPPTPTSPPPTGLARWLNPSTAPFIPVPEIATDPNGGTTVGLLPVWLRTDDSHDIDRIIAPDFFHNSYFGFGMHARLYEYPSEDEQWSVVAGAKERVEREFDLEYQVGRARRSRWTITGSLISDRDGTPRFYGIGNGTVQSAESNYTAQQQLARAQFGFNISRTWQLAYTTRVRTVDVQPGTLPGIDSIQQRFGNSTLGSSTEVLHRLSLVYDTRDDVTIPSRGMQWVAYCGVAARNAFFSDSLYNETGLDGRGFWPVSPDSTLAAHMAVRYLVGGSHNAPFWALSTLGGEQSEIAGEQPLRGFGAGRFTDRDSFSTTVEWRHRVLSFDAVSSHVDVEVAPFVDAGRVFSQGGVWPVDQLHHVIGVGFRGIARPFVVGYVDIGYGSEGSAIFTGLNYPF
jgi:Omp85 superfamily domain